MNIPGEEWIKTLEDGRKVKFIYQELPEDAALITAQLAGNEVVYSVAKQETCLVAKMLRVISRANCRRSRSRETVYANGGNREFAQGCRIF